MFSPSKSTFKGINYEFIIFFNLNNVKLIVHISQKSRLSSSGISSGRSTRHNEQKAGSSNVPGASIDSFISHGPGIFSGTFSGLSPTFCLVLWTQFALARTKFSNKIYDCWFFLCLILYYCRVCNANKFVKTLLCFCASVYNYVIVLKWGFVKVHNALENRYLHRAITYNFKTQFRLIRQANRIVVFRRMIVIAASNNFKNYISRFFFTFCRVYLSKIAFAQRHRLITASKKKSKDTPRSNKYISLVWEYREIGKIRLLFFERCPLHFYFQRISFIWTPGRFARANNSGIFHHIICHPGCSILLVFINNLRAVLPLIDRTFVLLRVATWNLL